VPTFDSLAELLPRKAAPAVVPTEPHREVWTHAALHAAVVRWAGVGGTGPGSGTGPGPGTGLGTGDGGGGGGLLSALGVWPRARVGVAVPNGPDLMAALMVVMARRAAVPVNPLAAASEVAPELAAVGCDAILYMGPTLGAGGKAGVSKSERIRVTAMREMAASLGVIALELRTGGVRRSGNGPTFEIERFGGAPLIPSPVTDRDWPLRQCSPRSPITNRWQRRERESHTALVLHTSGSTGRKKAVPVSARSLVVGGVCVAASQLLSPADLCCNTMPLFHVGGVVRNLAAPLLSGGATAAMPFFDPADFWDAVQRLGCTWYYAAPTMHASIVGEANRPGGPRPPNRIRLVANAAGPLLPAATDSLRACFPNAAVLPCYGMTECMPITCPPPGYALERPGSCGQAVVGFIALFVEYESC
jgi:acyl-CoA synthetase (AMP-forming)/AMP-acid ligase II